MKSKNVVIMVLIYLLIAKEWEKHPLRYAVYLKQIGMKLKLI